MTYFLRYLSVIFLLYNVIVLVVSCFLYRYYEVFRKTNGRQYFLLLVFIGCHSLYLLLEIFLLNTHRVYTVPFGLLYGPIIYNAIEYNNVKDRSSGRKLIGFLPFILVFVAMIIFCATENQFLYNQYLFQVLYYVASALTLFYFGIKLLLLFLKEIIKANFKSVLQFKFHFEVGVLLIIAAFVHVGFFIHFDKDNIIHSPVIIHVFMTIGVVLVCVKMFEIQKSLSQKVDAGFSVTADNIDLKYAKSRLEDEVLNEYQHSIETLADDFFYQPDLKLEMLEDKLKIKKYYLTQTFSMKMETSFIKYTNKKRVEFAVKLIETNACDSVSDIAYKVGFSSVPNFNRAFVLNFNKTPRQFKKELFKENK